MSEQGSKTIVSVVIAGEEYKLRADATTDYTRDCAAYVDRTLGDVMRQGPLVEGHKAAILAALSLTDQLFQARREADRLRAELARQAESLRGEIETALRG